MGATGDLGADTTESHDEERLPFEVAQRRHIVFPGPLALALPVHEVGQMTAERHHERNDVLGDARARGALHVGDERLALAQQWLLHTALDACLPVLYPLQVNRAGEELR